MSAKEPRIPSEHTARLRLLGLTDVAAILGVDWYKVKALVERGELHAVRFDPGGDPYIPLRSVEAWQERVAQGLGVMTTTAPKRRGRPPTALRNVG